MSWKSVRVSNEVYEMLRKEAERTGSSISTLVENAVKLALHAIDSNKSLDDVVNVKIKQFPAKYGGICARCGKKIVKGEWVTYVIYEFKDKSRKTEIYHLRCMSKELASKYKKMVELKLIISELQKEAQELAKYVITFEPLKRIDELATSLTQVLNQLKQLFNRFTEYSTHEVIESLLEINENINEVKRQLALIRERLELIDKKKKLNIKTVIKVRK